MKSVFILSSERSGTNLLRSLIGRHSQISAPVAPHLLLTLGSTCKYYGDLNKKERSIKLIEDSMKIVNHSYHDWKLNKLSSNEIYEKYNPNSLIKIKDALFSEKALDENKSVYFSKELKNYRYFEQLIRELKETKFIYLHRDPRDIVVSWLRTPLFMHTPYQIITNWIEEQKACLDLLEKHPSKILSISYEELIEKTKETITKCLHFIGVKIEPICFQTDRNNQESKRNEFWKNLSKPIMTENSKKYLNELSEKDILIIESSSKEIMVKLGYTDLRSSADWNKQDTPEFKKMETTLTEKSKLKNKEFYETTMSQLKSKLEMQDKIYKEIIKDSENYKDEIL